MRKFNRHDLSRGQIQARHKRRYMALLMHGLPTPAGTRPREQKVHTGPPVFKPIPMRGIPDEASFLAGLSLFKIFPWLRRRQAPRKIEPPKEAGV